MKRLILEGGKAWSAADEGKACVATLLRDAGDEARIALCLFASEDDERAEIMREGNEKLLRLFSGDTKVEFKVLTLDTFQEVSAWANVIVIPGGSPAKLKRELEPYGDLAKLWDGKTIAGSSAGADIMCQKYMYLQDKTVGKGLGWLSVNLVPHWQAAGWDGWTPEDWDWAAKKLAGEPGKTSLLTIREGEFVEFAVQ